MLVATDKRILYIEADILFHSYDEIAYGIINGIAVRPTPVFTSLTLFSRVHEYTLSMVTEAAANKFRTVIEDITEHVGDIAKDSASTVTSAPETVDNVPTQPLVTPTATQQSFLETATTGVLTTASRTGEILATPVYIAHKDDKLHILTREKTQKSTNMSAQKPIALTILDTTSYRFVSVQGYAQQKTDEQHIRDIYDNVAALVANNAPLQAPLRDSSRGSYVVFEIEPTHISDNLS